MELIWILFGSYLDLILILIDSYLNSIGSIIDSNWKLTELIWISLDLQLVLSHSHQLLTIYYHNRSGLKIILCRDECSNKGGVNIGSCASGFGVCCTCKNSILIMTRLKSFGYWALIFTITISEVNKNISKVVAYKHLGILEIQDFDSTASEKYHFSISFY